MPVLVDRAGLWLPKARAAFLAAREATSSTNGALAEAIHGVRTVQGMGREAVNLQLFEEKARRTISRPAARHSRLAQIMVPIVDTLTGRHGDRHRRGGMMVLGRRSRSRHHGGVPVLRAALLRPDPLADHAVQRDAAGHGLGPAHLRGARRADRRDVDKPGAARPETIDGSVEFEDVTFGYVPGIPVLKT
jgi:ATP-binding cassette, subfamily B, multidrug efflux pump